MTTPNPRRSLGQAGEEIAVHALEVAGLTILARNWRCAAGEIDIVAQDVAPDYASGALWKYSQLVGKARYGAVTHPGAAEETHIYMDQ